MPPHWRHYLTVGFVSVGYRPEEPYLAGRLSFHSGSCWSIWAAPSNDPTDRLLRGLHLWQAISRLDETNSAADILSGEKRTSPTVSIRLMFQSAPGQSAAGCSSSGSTRALGPDRTWAAMVNRRSLAAGNGHGTNYTGNAPIRGADEPGRSI